MSRARLATAALALGLGASACIDEGIPPRPIAVVEPAWQGSVPGDGNTRAVLASATTCGAVHLVVVGDTVYWTDAQAGQVESVPTTGGAVTVVAANQADAGALAVDDTTAFWVSGKAVTRVPLAGGVPSVLVAASNDTENAGDENDVNALLVANGTLFFGRFLFASKLPADAGPNAKPLLIERSPEADMGRPGAFAVDADASHLYQTEIFHNAVSRETTDGLQNGQLEDPLIHEALAPDRIAVSQGQLLTDAIDVQDGNVYWANGVDIFSKAVGQSEHDPATHVTTALDGNAVTGFVVSGPFVYFGESDTNTVERAPLDTGLATVVAKNEPSARQFAADDAAIYWATLDCKIVRMPK